MLIPKKLVLHNVCQHVHKTIHYKPGITGVTGRNGAGKSNLVTVAQYFAVTGKTYDRSKPEMLHWDASRGHTEFTFQLGEDEMTLTRAVHSGTVKLESKSNEIKLTSAEANQFMADALGVTPDALLNTCWVRQGDLGSILKMSDTERLKFFQNLAGVKQAEAVRRHLQTGISRIPAYQDKSAALRELHDAVPRYEQTIEEIDTSLAETKVWLAKHKEAYEQQIVNVRLKPVSEQAENIRTANACLEAEERNLEQHLEKFKGILVEQDNAPIPLTAEEFANLRLYQDCDTEHKTLDTAQKAMDAYHEDDFGDEEEEKTTLKLLRAESADAERKMNAYKAGVCSECGRPHEGDFGTQQTLVDNFEKIEREITQSEELLRLYEQANQAKKLRDYSANKITEMEDKLKGCDRGDLIARKLAREEYDDKASERSEAQRRQRILQESINRLKAEVDKELAVPTISEEQLKAAQTIIRLYEDKRELRTDLERQVTGQKLLRDRAMQDLVEIGKEQERAAKADRAREVLTTVRDAFHTNKAPRLIMQKMLIGLNARMMNYLGSFEVDFSAYVNDQFQIICRFPGGREIPARLLSGGQSVALAVALRFSLSDLLAGNLPLIVMDEPTVFLDEGNVARLAQVLDKVRGLAKRGLFIQVATHEPEIMSSFTRTLEV
jgi:exonuclease SbcC